MWNTSEVAHIKGRAWTRAATPRANLRSGGGVVSFERGGEEMLDLVDVQISPFLLLIFRKFSTFSRQLKVSTRSDLSSRRLTVKRGYCILTSSALHTRIFEDSLCMFSFCSLPKPLSSPEFAPVAFLRCVSACARVCGHTSGSSCLLLRFHTRLQKCACLHRSRFFLLCWHISITSSPSPSAPLGGSRKKD